MSNFEGHSCFARLFQSSGGKKEHQKLKKKNIPDAVYYFIFRCEESAFVSTSRTILSNKKKFCGSYSYKITFKLFKITKGGR